MTDNQIDKLTTSEMSKLINRLRYARRKKRLLNPSRRGLVNNIDDIKEVVEKVNLFLEASLDDVKKRANVKGSKESHIVYTRNIMMYFCRNKTECSYAFIGLYFGNRDHSTVIHSCIEVENLMVSSKAYKELIDKIEASFVEASEEMDENLYALQELKNQL